MCLLPLGIFSSSPVIIITKLLPSLSWSSLVISIHFSVKLSILASGHHCLLSSYPFFARLSPSLLATCLVVFDLIMSSCFCFALSWYLCLFFPNQHSSTHPCFGLLWSSLHWSCHLYLLPSRALPSGHIFFASLRLYLPYSFSRHLFLPLWSILIC